MPLLRVLAELHDSHGIIHRDIKPENIFLTANGGLAYASVMHQLCCGTGL